MEQREREILAMAEEVDQLRHQWAAFSRHSHRHYGPQADADDCWGRGPRGAAAAGGVAATAGSMPATESQRCV